jgi:SH3-like domain-containing protein
MFAAVPGQPHVEHAPSFRTSSFPRRREPSRLARGLILCAIGFGLMAAPGARAQNASPPTSTLQVPPKQKATPAPAPTPPKAAPREPVRQAGKSPPVVKPRGPTHAQKPPSKTKSAAPTAAAPAPAPAPPSPPVEPAKPPASDSKGSATSLPLPRFAALRSDEVNLRAGPGTRYPIEWVYKRRELPVQIQREFEVWRLVQDPDGIKGWVHQATLTGRRSFIVGAGDATLRRDAQDGAAAVAILKPGVVGHVRACQGTSDWCQVQVGDLRGFLRRSQFWGTLAGETVAN